MNDITNYVAGLPVWTAAAVFAAYYIGHVAHYAALYDFAAESITWRRVAWSLLWPIVTPIYILTYPLRRLVRWWRGRKAKPHTHIWKPTESPGMFKCRRCGIRKDLWRAQVAEMAPTQPDRSKAVRIPTGGVPEKPVSRSEFDELVAMYSRMRQREIEAGQRECDVTDRLAALEAKQPEPELTGWLPKHGDRVVFNDCAVMDTMQPLGGLTGEVQRLGNNDHFVVHYDPSPRNKMSMHDFDDADIQLGGACFGWLSPLNEAERLAAECREELGLH